jgi:predicted nucleotidyltransferase
MKFTFDKFTFDIDKLFLKFSLFIVISGSHAYGWNTDASDLDVRHVFAPDIKQALSIFYKCRTKQHKEKHDEGIIEFTTYPIQPFLGLLAKGNGNVLDNLFEATGPPQPVIYADKPKVAQLQKIVLSHLHKGFLMHCTGYDIHLKKDMENETRLERYGREKLLLNRYKILLEGLILANYGEVASIR